MLIEHIYSINTFFVFKCNLALSVRREVSVLDAALMTVAKRGARIIGSDIKSLVFRRTTQVTGGLSDALSQNYIRIQEICYLYKNKRSTITHTSLLYADQKLRYQNTEA